MRAYLLYVLKRSLDIFLAPLYFHFGHYSLFIDIMALLANLCDIVVLYHLYFIFLIGVILLRNKKFINFSKKFYKNYLETPATIFLLMYISSVYGQILHALSTLINFIKKLLK